MRLRPILMTSLAFILGVLPLAIATGAGSGSQNAIGTGVIGGMLAATVLGDLLRPAVLRDRADAGWPLVPGKRAKASRTGASRL